MEAINKEALRLLRLFGNTTSKKVTPSVGAEQEYFLVDAEKFEERKDLIYTGRTLFGAMPPKGQELDDHYFGTIRQRIASFMRDVNIQLWKVGVPSKTQHNEVAPAQHELAPIYNDAKIVSISPSATTPELTQKGDHPYFFRTIASDDVSGHLAGSFAKDKLGLKKVALLHDKGDYGRGFVNYAREMLEKGGVQIVLEEGITPGAVDYGAVIQKIRKAGADGIIFGGYHPEASKLVQQLAKKKIDIPFIGPDGVKDEQFIKVAGKNAEGVYATGPTDVSKLPMNIQAHENHKKKYGTEPGAFYDNAYSATVALLEAIKAAGSTDSQKIMEALRTNMVDTPLGKIKFDAKGDAEGIGFSIYEVKDGKFVELK